MTTDNTVSIGPGPTGTSEMDDLISRLTAGHWHTPLPPPPAMIPPLVVHPASSSDVPNSRPSYAEPETARMLEKFATMFADLLDGYSPFIDEAWEQARLELLNEWNDWCQTQASKCEF